MLRQRGYLEFGSNVERKCTKLEGDFANIDKRCENELQQSNNQVGKFEQWQRGIVENLACDLKGSSRHVLKELLLRDTDHVEQKSIDIEVSPTQWIANSTITALEKEPQTHVLG